MTHDEVESLARQMRLDEARRLALAIGDPVRALELAIEAREVAAIEEVAAAIAALGDGKLGDRARAAALRRRDALAEAIVAEAIGALDDAVQLYERAEAHGRAARIHRRRGEVAKAGRALERQVQRDPTDASARKELAELLLLASRPDAALRAIAGLSADDVVDRIRREAHRALGLSADAEPAPRPEANDARLLFGRYEVVRDVASTPSARVVEARDRLDPSSPRVALKIFTGTGHLGAGRDALARFRREMEALSRIEASSVLKSRALLDEGPTLVFPWAGGGNVDDLIARGRPSPRRAAEIVRRVLDALDAAHRRGIIHRDVKPSNVLLDEAGGAYLADFGVAHLGDASATATAGVIGTLRYMAPEQRLGEPATARSDLYAVGVLLCELLGVAHDGPRSALPSDVSALLDELLRAAPDERPADAASVLARIEAIAWPDEPFHLAARGPSSLRPSSPAPGSRFEAYEGHRRDRLLERDELLVAPDDPRFPVACALARIHDPLLPSVLGLEAGSLRVELVRGDPVVALGREEHARLVKALRRLHEQGVAHGDVARSLVRTRRGVALAFPSARDDASFAADLRALAALQR